MLHSDLLRDPYPTRPYLHAVGDDLTDVIRVFRSVVAYDHFNSFDRSYRRRLTLIPAANIRIEMRKYRVSTQSFVNCPPAFCSFRLYQLLSDRLKETKKSVQKEKKRKNVKREQRKRERPRDRGTPRRIGVRSTDSKRLDPLSRVIGDRPLSNSIEQTSQKGLIAAVPVGDG